ncbi:MAG TPA: hypothetical protein DEP84_03850, partial [Chloroflexi bacterium]|nr:hypothetical protein [Chloroflexota bacterium]
RSRGWRPGVTPVLDKVPFQVLALGGDDISLFAWAPVATSFAAEFTRLTDLEFAATSHSRLRPDAHLTFSLGLLVTDEKTPVVKSVDFTERDLLGWAKQVAKGNRLNHGTIAMLYAQSAEGIPASLEAYRRETYLLGAEASFQLCTTLRPYSAEELQQLLTVATWVIERGHLSRLQRLVGAFYGTRQGAAAGLLHYAYQRGRSAGRGWIEALEHQLGATDTNRSPTPRALLVNYPPGRPARTPFGVEWQPATYEKQPTIWFSPLWDLMELAKLMS